MKYGVYTIKIKLEIFLRLRLGEMIQAIPFMFPYNQDLHYWEDGSLIGRLDITSRLMDYFLMMEISSS
jgi:hypothetical protein